MNASISPWFHAVICASSTARIAVLGSLDLLRPVAPSATTIMKVIGMHLMASTSRWKFFVRFFEHHSREYLNRGEQDSDQQRSQNETQKTKVGNAAHHSQEKPQGVDLGRAPDEVGLHNIV